MCLCLCVYIYVLNMLCSYPPQASPSPEMASQPSLLGVIRTFPSDTPQKWVTMTLPASKSFTNAVSEKIKLLPTELYGHISEILNINQNLIFFPNQEFDDSGKEPTSIDLKSCPVMMKPNVQICCSARISPQINKNLFWICAAYLSMCDQSSEVLPQFCTSFCFE